MVRRFDLCRRPLPRVCRRRVQGRHPLQTSDAVGVGAVQLGPEALTLAAILNKQMGLSLGHTRQVLSYGFGWEASRGDCGGRAGAPGCPGRSRLIPGWWRRHCKCGERGGRNRLESGRNASSGLHVAVSAQVTVYAILPGRGYQQSAVILGRKLRRVSGP